MACISKLASAIAYDCDSGMTGFASAVIINKSDIAGYVVESSTMKGSWVILVSVAQGCINGTG